MSMWKLPSLGLLGLMLTLPSLGHSQDIGSPAPGQKKATNRAENPTFHSDPTGLNQTPWFSDPDVRTELKLADEQYERLNGDYTNSWRRYNEGVNALPLDLAEEDHLQRRRELSTRFYSDYSPALEATLTDAAARRRYQQLDWQYRGYAAFEDPGVRKQLHISDEQMRQLGGYNSQWNTQMSKWRSDYATQRDQTTKQFNESRAEARARINSILTPEQRAKWNELIGKPYDFSPGVYFRPSTTGAATKPARTNSKDATREVTTPRIKPRPE